jgi:ADP-heptose:LPS heptosyltransferase
MKGLGCEGTSRDLEFSVDGPCHKPLPGPYVVLHPGARDPQRRWHTAGFAAVATALAHRFGLHPVITGMADESALARALATAAGVATTDLTALDLPLDALAAVISGAALVVCNDTGVSHLAAALKRPSVVLFCRDDLRRWAPLDHARHLSLLVGLQSGTAAAVAAACSQALAFGHHAGGWLSPSSR